MASLGTGSLPSPRSSTSLQCQVFFPRLPFFSRHQPVPSGHQPSRNKKKVSAKTTFFFFSFQSLPIFLSPTFPFPGGALRIVSPFARFNVGQIFPPFRKVFLNRQAFSPNNQSPPFFSSLRTLPPPFPSRQDLTLPLVKKETP